MSDLNLVALAGRLTKDPEVRTIKSGTSVCDISIACNRRKSDEADFFDVTFWGKTAETAGSYLKKGRFITLQGHLKQERWETEDGSKRTKVAVVAESFNFGPDGSTNNGNTQQSKASKTVVDNHVEDDAVPF